MAFFLIKRLIHGIVVLWVVATLTFILLRLAPGGPFDTERRLPPEVLANIEAKYHLDEPLWGQYLRYLGGIVHADLGPSYKYLNGRSAGLSPTLCRPLLSWVCLR